ncbi:MAG: chlorophyll synthesis pathway protein BchC [Pseudomonadota bacterium]
METLAVVMQRPGEVALSRLELPPLDGDALVIDVLWSGISTGTERLLWQGTMPTFPGMGYPLVPGYETVGRVSAAAAGQQHRIGELVFVSGARCFGDIRGLFGGAASRLVVPAEKAHTINESLGEHGILLALAATAQHALRVCRAVPELIVGHGVLGRLLARLVIAHGQPAPVVWEIDASRRQGAEDYAVVDPSVDARRDYQVVCDVSGSVAALDQLIGHTARGAKVVLAGFYSDRVSFAFPPAFMRELTFSVAAEWQPEDLEIVSALAANGSLSLHDLITHHADPAEADRAYRTAFDDPACLKMMLDWSQCRES